MITFVPVGGLANRMRAIDSAIALAQDANHELQIIWFKDQGLNCSFCDLFQPFSLPGVTVREANKRDLLLQDRPRKKNFYLPALSLSTQYDSKIYEKEVTDLFYQQFDFKQWAQKHRNIWMASYIYFYPTQEKRYHIFRPIQALAQQIEERCSSWNTSTIGVHIRRTDHVDSIRQSPTELFIQKMEEIISTNNDTLFYLATDSEEEKQRLTAHFGTRIQTSPHKASRNTKSGIQEGLVELYTLSRASHILGSSNSSYTDAAALLGGIKNEVIMKDYGNDSRKDDIIHIALATDNNYIVPTTVALQSIFQHHPQKNVSIYLCYVEQKLKDEFLDFFIQHAAKHNIKLTPLMISQEQLANLPETRHGKAALLRLCLPELLPQLDRILYLDGDVVVEDSLEKLYHTPLNGNYIAAVKDTLPIYHPEYIQNLNIGKEHDYFNTGVVLLNLEALRKIHLIEKIKDFADKHYHQITLPDQDALNFVCQGKTSYIPPRYNMNYSVEKDVAEQTWGKEQIKEAKCTPAIIHYVGPVKPWSVLCVHPQRKRWWKVLKDTPFKNYKPKDATFKNRIRKIYLWICRQFESHLTLEKKRELGKNIPDSLKKRIKKSAMKSV